MSDGTEIKSYTMWEYKGERYRDWESARRREYEDRLEIIMADMGISAADHIMFLAIIDKMLKADTSMLADYVKLRAGHKTDEND